MPEGATPRSAAATGASIGGTASASAVSDCTASVMATAAAMRFGLRPSFNFDGAGDADGDLADAAFERGRGDLGGGHGARRGEWPRRRSEAAGTHADMADLVALPAESLPGNLGARAEGGDRFGNELVLGLPARLGRNHEIYPTELHARLEPADQQCGGGKIPALQADLRAPAPAGLVLRPVVH